MFCKKNIHSLLHNVLMLLRFLLVITSGENALQLSLDIVLHFKNSMTSRKRNLQVMAVSTISRHLQSLNILCCYSVTILIYWSSLDVSVLIDLVVTVYATIDLSLEKVSHCQLVYVFSGHPLIWKSVLFTITATNTQTIVPESYDCR